MVQVLRFKDVPKFVLSISQAVDQMRRNAGFTQPKRSRFERVLTQGPASLTRVMQADLSDKFWKMHDTEKIGGKKNHDDFIAGHLLQL